MKAGNPQILYIGGKKIAVYISQNPDSPVIYLNTFEEEGEQVYKNLQEAGCLGFTLAAISGLSWQHDMSPWAIQPIAKNDTPCTGGAGAYLQLMTEEIVPSVERLLPGKVLWRGLAGYSLGGLFALYALYQRDIFSRAASASGSFWFPAWKEYVFANQMKTAPEAIYISLGDRECRTRNPYMKTVQECTEEISAHYKGQGIDIVYELNRGNHFQDAVLRMSSGIAWILER